MDKHPPSTPAEVLDISVNALKLFLRGVVWTAELFGWWRYPYRKASTDVEEMTFLDSLYWAFKCTNPIVRAERESSCVFPANRGSLLPDAFEKRASITFGAAGDLLYTDYLEHSKDVLFEKVAPLLFDQDVSFANFESPITEQQLVKEVIGDKGPPTECCSSRQFDVLKGHKGRCFIVLNTANNHKFDMGLEGIETTQRLLKENGILEIGTNVSPDECGQGRVLVSNEIKLGFVSATFGLNGKKLPEGEEYRINVAKLHSKVLEPQLDVLKRQIDFCKREGCDFIFASLHWGYEFEFFPRQRQIDIAHTLIEYGADSIIGHHPHVIQPVEFYRTQRDPHRTALICYSLGSLSWGFFGPHLALSSILNLKLSKGRFEDRDETYIEDVRVTPVFRRAFEKNGQIRVCIEKLDDFAAETASEQLEIKKMRDYAETVLGSVGAAAH